MDTGWYFGDVPINKISEAHQNYPPQFLDLQDHPSTIYTAGNHKTLTKHGIAIVGSRYATEQGKSIAYQLAKLLDESDYNIVSGLAKGVDTAAHLGSLDGSGSTTAILPSGFEHIMPQENRDLAINIAEKGILLSEYQPHIQAKKHYYKSRDRLQAALSKVVIVIETELDGGTMHTTEFAFQLQREVFVIQFEEINRVREGNLQIASKGARPLKVDQIDDIVDYIRFTD